MSKRNMVLEDIFNKYKNMDDRGEIADYIPELKKANYYDLGLSIFDLERGNFDLGQHDKKFTMQSISKIISLTLVLEDRGIDYFMSRVGLKGSADPFNSLYKLDFENIDKPDNPMMNIGAILTTSLIIGDREEKLDRIIGFIRRITGNNDIDYNRDVYLSEKNTGDKNKSIAYLLKARGLLEGEIEDILDIYFKQCSIEINTRDLAKIGGFYAGHGRDIFEGGEIIDPKIIRLVNSIMTMAGMYNYSGEYAALVGIPSKSGVSGGILGVIPNKLGIAVYSPGLDEYGNSLIGYRIMRDISEKLNYSIF